ncbi:hypothetical protein [Actinomadura alba]|uniref:PucR family transcriptional regulator n=1 Tax=Actinomadura alba TaxID=406431 RepID=A0ABR7LRH6_9ACTN|nr:hypothetical protein [Actinomadura alba]MBC6467355.1 hypothetical protein [Actinomadura alba]
MKQLLDDLGGTLLDLVCGDPGAAAQLGSVVIHDPHDELRPPPGAVVLGVGVRDPDEIGGLLRRLAQDAAAALVIRAPVPVTDAVRGRR